MDCSQEGAWHQATVLSAETSTRCSDPPGSAHEALTGRLPTSCPATPARLRSRTRPTRSGFARWRLRVMGAPADHWYHAGREHVMFAREGDLRTRRLTVLALLQLPPSVRENIQ